MKNCPKGGKRCFDSKRQARQATRSVGNRLRVYRCPACRKHEDTARRAVQSIRTAPKKAA